MKATLVIITFILSIGIAYPQTNLSSKKISKTAAVKREGPVPTPLECSLLRTGTFKTTLDHKTTTMIRSGQTETDYLGTDPGNPIIYRVKWKSECEYVLTPTPETYKKHPEIVKGAVFTVDTYLRNTNSWTQTVSTNYSKAKVNMEVYKIK